MSDSSRLPPEAPGGPPSRPWRATAATAALAAIVMLALHATPRSRPPGLPRLGLSRFGRRSLPWLKQAFAPRRGSRSRVAVSLMAMLALAAALFCLLGVATGNRLR